MRQKKKKTNLNLDDKYAGVYYTIFCIFEKIFHNKKFCPSFRSGKFEFKT